MNTEQLRSTVEFLLGEERELQGDVLLGRLLNTVGNLASSPGTPDYQIQVRQQLDQLAAALSNLRSEHDPVFAGRLEEIGALPYFSKALLSRIELSIAANSMTPAVAQQEISTLVTERAAYIISLTAIENAFQALGLGEDEVEVGQAQVGFKLPRELFDNELSGWISELNELKRIVRAFSELATGETEPIEIGQISTTDPLIFLIVSAPTVAAIGKAVAWSLDQWKKVEEIKKIRAETAKISATIDGQMDDVVAQLDAKVDSAITAAIEKHSRELVQPTDEPGRQHEQVADISIALRSLVARVERGMTVEVKFLSRVDAGQEPDGVDDHQAFEELKRIVPQLSFPTANPAPVIALPGYVDKQAQPGDNG